MGVLWSVVSGTSFCWVGSGSSLFHVGSVGSPDGDGHLFWECTFPPLVEIRENPEFHDLMREHKAQWPRCLLWHGWLPMLSGVNGASPWAGTASEGAFYLVETALGRYSSGLVSEWSPPYDFDADEVSARMLDAPKVWSDGSIVLDSVTGVSAAGAGMSAHVDRVQSGGVAHSCGGFVSVPGPLQTVQRAELWEVILALQSADAVHIGVDNLGVVRHVGRLLDGCSFAAPLELVTDGDLLFLLRRMIGFRGRDTVRVTKVKGRADEGVVSDGRVRELDRLGNNAADEAADFGRRRVGPAVIDARRNLSGVCGRWYPVLLDLHRFFIAISRAVVKHDGFGGTAPDPMIWSACSLPKRRSVALDADDVAQWPYTPGLLVKWVSFLGSLHWPVHGGDLGVGGISYVELLILYELWAGEMSAVPFGPGIDIWRSCRFIGAMMRSLCMLPGGLGRFVPCSIGADQCRLRHLGWERCSHGLTSRPQESAPCPFLDQLLLLFHYPPRSSGALLAGSPLRYCSAKFASRTPFWALPVPGHVTELIADDVRAAQVGEALVVRRGVDFVGASGSGRKRFRLNRKKPSTPRGTLCACSSTGVEEVAFFWDHWFLRC